MVADPTVEHELSNKLVIFREGLLPAMPSELLTQAAFDDLVAGLENLMPIYLKDYFKQSFVHCFKMNQAPVHVPHDVEFTNGGSIMRFRDAQGASFDGTKFKIPEGLREVNVGSNIGLLSVLKDYLNMYEQRPTYKMMIADINIHDRILKVSL